MVSPTIYKSERMNVLAPDLDGHVVVDSPDNRGVDVKCENAATRIDECFWRGEGRFFRLKTPQSSARTRHPMRRWENQAARPMSALPASFACTLQRVSSSEVIADLLSCHLKLGNGRVERRAPILGGYEL